MQDLKEEILNYRDTIKSNVCFGVSNSDSVSKLKAIIELLFNAKR